MMGAGEARSTEATESPSVATGAPVTKNSPPESEGAEKPGTTASSLSAASDRDAASPTTANASSLKTPDIDASHATATTLPAESEAPVHTPAPAAPTVPATTESSAEREAKEAHEPDASLRAKLALNEILKENEQQKKLKEAAIADLQTTIAAQLAEQEKATEALAKKRAQYAGLVAIKANSNALEQALKAATMPAGKPDILKKYLQENVFQQGSPLSWKQFPKISKGFDIDLSSLSVTAVPSTHDYIIAFKSNSAATSLDSSDAEQRVRYIHDAKLFLVDTKDTSALMMSILASVVELPNPNPKTDSDKVVKVAEIVHVSDYAQLEAMVKAFEATGDVKVYLTDKTFAKIEKIFAAEKARDPANGSKVDELDKLLKSLLYHLPDFAAAAAAVDTEEAKRKKLETSLATQLSQLEQAQQELTKLEAKKSEVEEERAKLAKELHKLSEVPSRKLTVCPAGAPAPVKADAGVVVDDYIKEKALSGSALLPNQKDNPTDLLADRLPNWHRFKLEAGKRVHLVSDGTAWTKTESVGGLLANACPAECALGYYAEFGGVVVYSPDFTQGMTHFFKEGHWFALAKEQPLIKLSDTHFLFLFEDRYHPINLPVAADTLLPDTYFNMHGLVWQAQDDKWRYLPQISAANDPIMNNMPGFYIPADGGYYFGREPYKIIEFYCDHKWMPSIPLVNNKFFYCGSKIITLDHDNGMDYYYWIRNKDSDNRVNERLISFNATVSNIVNPDEMAGLGVKLDDDCNNGLVYKSDGKWFYIDAVTGSQQEVTTIERARDASSVVSTPSTTRCPSFLEPLTLPAHTAAYCNLSRAASMPQTPATPPAQAMATADSTMHSRAAQAFSLAAIAPGGAASSNPRA